MERGSLVIISAMYASRVGGGVRAHMSFGRIIDGLAGAFDRVVLCVPLLEDEEDQTRDYELSPGNLSLIPQPFFRTTVEGLGKPFGILKAYWQAAGAGDSVFVRGMVPYVFLLYLMCFFRRRRPVHWIVGDPESLLRSHKRRSWLKDRLALAFAFFERHSVKIGRSLTRGAFLCNGRELAEVYRSARTRVVVSTTVRRDEIFHRNDACRESKVKILFVGFLRPEKGLEYLIQALALLPSGMDFSLSIVGEFQNFLSYREKILSMVTRYGLDDAVQWKGYLSFGGGLEEELRAADLLVLPSLSEGTPRVLVEARANGVPVVATRVGGIPSSVTDGYDGILVDVKSPEAISEAILQLTGNPELCSRLVANGYSSMEKLTVEYFVDQLVRALQEDGVPIESH